MSAASKPPPPPPPARHTHRASTFNDTEYCNSRMFSQFASNSNNNHNIKEDENEIDEWDGDEDDEESFSPSLSPTSLSQPRGSLSDTVAGSSETLHFRRSGADAYLFSATNPVPSGVNPVYIINGADGLIWKAQEENYTCSVSSPKKETKFAGMKSFMTYQLTPTFSNIQVSRRYKQFMWLYQRLTEKFTTISIPPLPEKSQMVGKFEGDFINSRLRLLQLWVLRMCKHPVVSHADVFLHFLTCTDDKRWTKGKRVAEKDEYIRGQWFTTVQAPSFNSQQGDAQIETFSRFVKSMDDGLRQMISTCDHNMKKQESFKKEYQKLGASFSEMAKSVQLDERPKGIKLTKAIEHTGKVYDDIGLLFGTQSLVDMVDLVEGLQEYKGILTTFHSSIAIHKESLNKVKEKTEKLSDNERQAVLRRADVITSTVLSNMLYFQQERVSDFKEYMCHYLQKQIEFHTTITAKLRENLQQYEKI